MGNVMEIPSLPSLLHRVGHTHWMAQQLLTRSSNYWKASVPRRRWSQCPFSVTPQGARGWVMRSRCAT